MGRGSPIAFVPRSAVRIPRAACACPAAPARVTLLALLTLSASLASPARAITLPPGFVADPVVPSFAFTTPTCVATPPDGRLLVGEQSGRVWVVRSGVIHPFPLWDGSEEVLEHVERGLMDVAVDPAFATNRFVYFLFTVNPDSAGSDFQDDAYGRLVRYAISASDSNALDPASRAVLFGASWSDGPIVGSFSHTVGSLRFGRDGSLLVSIGDGAQFSYVDPGGFDPGMFGPGFADPYENIGAFRAQDPAILCGKVLRIDPHTGLGYANNPFYDGDLASKRSRVWVYGLRNPFRFCVRPGTGALDPADGEPGTLYIGDVGWQTWEETNVARVGGLNFGWPCREGFAVNSPYVAASPAHHGCGTLGTPVNPALPTAPIAAWNRDDPGTGTPPGFVGNTSIGGVFYDGDSWPSEYHGRYVFADFGADWIQLMETDSLDQLVGVTPFIEEAGGPADFAADPATGDLFYTSLFTGEVRRIRWTGAGGDVPPIAVAQVSSDSGAVPFVTDFSSAGTSDSDGDTLRYLWLFGDGAVSDAPNPQHTYIVAGQYLAILIVDDGRGGISRDSVEVRVTSPFDFPTTGLLDFFQRPNGVLGALWSGETADLAIESEAVVLGGLEGRALYAPSAFGPLQEAYFRLPAYTPGTALHGVILKAQSTSLDSAHLEVLLSNDRIRIWSYSPAAGLVQHGPSVPATLADGARFGARAYPNGVVEVFIEDTLAASTAVTDWPWIGSGGRIGFRMTAAYVSRLDDFGGGDGDPSGNRPPVALVTSPAAETTFYAPGDTIRLAATGLDPDDAPESLDYHWSVLNRHIGHAHPTLQADAAETSFVATNHGEGASVSYEMRIFVFDPAELSATALVRAFPDVDLSPGPVSVLPATPVSGESAQWSFRLRNTGRMKTLPTRWQLVLGADVIAEGDTTIAAHDSVLVTRFTTVSAPPGSYDLRIVADTLAAAVETDETNNALDASLEVVPPTAGVEARPSLELAVRSPVPNPTSGAVRFEIELLHAAELRLAVLDLQGREIWSGAPARRAAGVTSLAWNGRLAGGARAAPGVYHARVLIDGRAFARRFVVLR